VDTPKTLPLRSGKPLTGLTLNSGLPSTPTITPIKLSLLFLLPPPSSMDSGCLFQHNIPDMASTLSNPYAHMLGTLRDLPAHPITIEKILDIIYLQLQLLTTATSALIETPTAPIKHSPVASLLGTGRTTQCPSYNMPNSPLQTPPRQSPPPSDPPEDWHEQVYSSQASSRAHKVRPSHLTTLASPTSSLSPIAPQWASPPATPPTRPYQPLPP